MEKLARNRGRVRMFRLLMGLAARIRYLPEKLTPPAFRVMQISTAFWQSRALYTATRLGLADALGDGRKDIAELADTLNLDAGHLHRLLRMLAANGIFRQTAPREFANNDASHYLRSDRSPSIRELVLMHHSPEMTRAWNDWLEPCIRSGGVPFRKANGHELFEYMDRNRDFDLLFSRAMDSVENLIGNAWLEDFNWGAFDRIIDVGGSRGGKALAVLEAWPQLRAVVFDRPQLIDTARDFWTGKIPAEILERVDFQAGDMFHAIPAAASERDLFVLFAIFHGLSDGDGRRLLANLRAACGARRSHVLIGDTVADEMDIDPVIAAFDMQMLVGTRGRERTLAEWTALLQDGGFRLVEVVEVRSFAKLLLAAPS